MMVQSQTYTSSLSVSSWNSWLQSCIQIIGASLFIALCAQIEIPLFFTPVPITGQTLGIILTGALLGSRRGALSVLLYIMEGSMGLPVFAGASFGAMRLIGPTGGYFLGFIAQAYLIGWFFERLQVFTSGKVLTAILVSSVVQMGIGVMWLSHFVGFDHVMVMGFYPFIPGEILKALAVTTSLQSQWKRS